MIIAPAVERRGARGARRQAERARCSTCGQRPAHAGRDSTSSASAAACWCRTPTSATVQRSELQGRHQDASRPTQQMDDLLFAWQVAKFVKSNAIVFAQRRHDASASAPAR
ncbi:MAG: hypothetical protein MZV65_37645 [Chromatiales bacterium]|nr:hypothetical protein [Chromatiales bacterium]